MKTRRGRRWVVFENGDVSHVAVVRKHSSGVRVEPPSSWSYADFVPNERVFTRRCDAERAAALMVLAR